jgi:cation-transporting ATPase F
MQEKLQKHWHHLTYQEVSDLLVTHLDTGLTTQEVSERQNRFGPNSLSVREENGPLKRFLLQCHQPLVYILIVAGITTALLQEWVDASSFFQS